MAAAVTINNQPISAFRGARVRWQSGAPGELVLTLGIDDPVPESVTLRVGNEVRFIGSLHYPSLAESDAREERRVRYRDAWQALTTRVWRQAYPFDTSSEEIARCVLGGKWQAFDAPGDPAPGEVGQYELVPENLAVSLRDAIEDAGLEEDVTISAIIPPAELVNTTCAQAIQAGLRWLPDAQAYCIPGSADTIRIAKSAGDFKLKLAGSEGDHPEVSAYEITPRPDLVIPGAKVHLSKVVRGRGSKEEVTTYSYGSGDNFIHLVQLADEVHVFEAAAIEVAQINPTSAAWWAAHDRQFAAMVANSTLFPELNTTPIDTQIIRADNDLTYEVVRGSIPDSFVDEGCSGPFGARQKVFSVANGTQAKVGSVTVRARFRVWNAAGGVPSVQQFYTATVDLPLCTNLSNSGVYLYEDNRQTDPGEDPSDFAGVAQMVVEGTARLGHQGWAEWVEEDLPHAADILGKLFSLVGTDMQAPIFAVEQVLDPGDEHTRIEFGPNGYLGVEDFVELLRARKQPRRRRARADQNGGEIEPLSPPASAGPSSLAPAAPPATGRVRVQIEPAAAVDAGAAWFAVCTDEQGKPMVSGPHPSDEFVRLPQGEAVIWFQPVNGFNPPAVIEGFENTSSDQTISAEDATYTPTVVGVHPFFPRMVYDSGSETWTLEIRSDGATVQDGLDGAQLPIGGDLGVPTPVSEGDRAYLAFTIEPDEDTGEPAVVDVSLVIDSDWWPGYPARVLFDEENVQTDAFVPVAEVYDAGDTLKARPLLFTALMVEHKFFAGLRAIYPTAWGSVPLEA